MNESRYTKYDAVKKTLDLFYDTPVYEPGAWLADDDGIHLDKVFTFKMVFDKLNETPNLEAFATMMVAVSNTPDSDEFMQHVCTALTYLKKHAKRFGGKVEPVATKLFRNMFHRNMKASAEDDMEGGGYTENVSEAVENYATNAAKRFVKAFGPFDIQDAYKEIGVDILVDTLVKSLTSPPIVAIYSALGAAGIKVDAGDLENFQESLELEETITDALKDLGNVKAAVWPGKIEAPGFGAAMYPSAITSLFTKEPKLTETSTVYCVVNMSLTPSSDLEVLSEFYNKYNTGAPLTCDERTREIKLLAKVKYPSLYEAAENLGHERPAVGAEVGHQGVVGRYPK